MKIRHLIALCGILLSVPSSSIAQSSPSLEPFDVSVTNLDWDPFSTSFIDATDESGLIGWWQTADYSFWYIFREDHSVTKAWDPKDPSVTETYSNIVPLASMTGHWKLDGKQLVITMDSEFVPESSYKVTTVHLSSKQGTTSWTIVSISDSTMTWSTTTSDDCVSRSIQLKLRHVGHPQLFTMNRG
jgi:hypothetical protein